WSGAVAATDRGKREARLSADDCGDRRLRQRRIDRRAHDLRIPDDRDPPECRAQIRPLARHRDDAALARRGWEDGAVELTFTPHGEERVGVHHRAALRADPLARLEP